MVLDKETQHQHRISAIKSYNFHFKIKENGIECFYPGTKIQWWSIILVQTTV